MKNPTADAIKIKVSISSNLNNRNYFSGKEVLEIAPNGTAEYEVIYNPLTMTANPDCSEITEE